MNRAGEDMGPAAGFRKSAGARRPARDLEEKEMTEETAGNLYPASLSPRAKVITYTVGYGVGLGVPLTLAAAFHLGLGDPMAWLLPVPFAVILLLTRAFRPLGYRIASDTLAILRPAGEKRFATADIDAVAYPAADPPGVTLGLFRVDGFYGAWGVYWNRSWGRFRVYVTDAAHRVEIRLKDGGRIILSPDDPEGFAADLRLVLGGTARG